MATWPADLVLVVNVSPSLLTMGAVAGIADEIGDACRTHESKPTNLCLEITEPPILDVDQARAALARLATMGVLVAADDFGAGATSLARLRDLPFHICKLDRSLVVETGPDSQLTAAIIDVAHALGMAVVAEGIEAANQYRAMARAGADLGQGFHLRPPLPPQALRDLLLREESMRGRVSPHRFEGTSVHSSTQPPRADGGCESSLSWSACSGNGTR